MVEMVLLAESGSTKTDWILLSSKSILGRCQSKGINPYVHDNESIKEVIGHALNELNIETSSVEVHFYGAGCSNEESVGKVHTAFTDLAFKQVSIHHDLLAAARSLFQSDEGIACILGTGSSSCLYKNAEVIDHIPALGYVLGDEGGGVDLGRRLIQLVVNRKAPEEVIREFQMVYKLSAQDILHKVYFEDSPNRFLASFSPYIQERLNQTFYKDLVVSAFESFIECKVLPYQQVDALPVAFSGSVAFYFSEVLKDVLKSKNKVPGLIIKSPLEGLIQYHQNLISGP